MKAWTISSLVLCYLLHNVKAAAYYDSIRSEKTVFGTEVKYCHYNGIDILPGSIVRNKDKCEEASCTEDYLQVVGIGINAGVISVDNGCAVVPDGCTPRIVSLSCPQQTPLTPIKTPIARM